ncbi:MAG TPA: uracil-DNA glycosylase [Aquificales bacterium]|nr:uracil-DNA glycosylase [Aquificales bacterium]
MQNKIIATLKLLKELGFDEFYSLKGDKTPLSIYQENSVASTQNGEKKDTKQRLLWELYEKNKNCCRCDLCKSRTRIVFYDGNPESEVMFVGEAPGEEEDKKGKPFVGRAGQYLTRVLKEIGLSRERVYITNVCKCRPPNNRKPTPKEMQTCINVFLKRELEIVKPKVVCCLGATAAEAFLGKSVRITRMRGKFYPNPLYPTAKLFLTYHPAYILRNMKEAKTFKEDLKKLKEFLDTLKGEN